MPSFAHLTAALAFAGTVAANPVQLSKSYLYYGPKHGLDRFVFLSQKAWHRVLA